MLIRNPHIDGVYLSNSFYVQFEVWEATVMYHFQKGHLIGISNVSTIN